MIWRHLLFECLGYCNELNRDWGCLCSDQRHIAPVSADEPWNSHRALGWFHKERSVCHFSRLGLDFFRVISIHYAHAHESYWSPLSLFLSLLAKMYFLKAPIESGTAAILLVYVTLWEMVKESAEKAWCIIKKKKTYASIDSTSARIIHQLHCHELKCSKTKNKLVRSRTRVLTALCFFKNT